MSLQDHLIIPDWPAPPNVKALQTTRHGGISAAPYDTLNLGDHVGDAPMNVARNRMLLSPLLPSEPVWLEQVHGTIVANADMAGCRVRPRHGDAEHSGAGVAALHLLPQTAGYASNVSEVQADACIARHRDSVCVVMTADCLPVLLCDKQGSVVGAAHAGWKGLAAGVIEATVQAMNVVPQDLMAWLGPAIGQNSFEVGEEVRAAFIAAHLQAASAFIPSLLTSLPKPSPQSSPASGRGGERERQSSILAGEGVSSSLPGGERVPGRAREGVKYLADIYALARMRLNALGITQIYGGNYCTYREPDKFFSYRRDGVTGRMGTFIWLAE